MRTAKVVAKSANIALELLIANIKVTEEMPYDVLPSYIMHYSNQ